MENSLLWWNFEAEKNDDTSQEKIHNFFQIFLQSFLVYLFFVMFIAVDDYQCHSVYDQQTGKGVRNLPVPAFCKIFLQRLFRLLELLHILLNSLIFFSSLLLNLRELTIHFAFPSPLPTRFPSANFSLFKRLTEVREKANFHFFATIGKRNQRVDRKQKTKVPFRNR